MNGHKGTKVSIFIVISVVILITLITTTFRKSSPKTPEIDVQSQSDFGHNHKEVTMRGKSFTFIV